MAKEIELTPFERKVQAVRVKYQFHRRLSILALALAVVFGAIVIASFVIEFLYGLPHPQLASILQVVMGAFAAISWEFSRWEWKRASTVFQELYTQGG